MMQSRIKVTLRNPLDFNDRLDYYIDVFDTEISQKWYRALETLLLANPTLEKNFCFLGWPNTARTLDYLCNELNRHVAVINHFNSTEIWQTAGLDNYVIEEWFCPNSVRFPADFLVASGGHHSTHIGLQLKRNQMNRLHNHFEVLQGTVNHLSEYYKLADYRTKYAIRQLNNICHEIESLVLAQRKQHQDPKWVRPSQITTFLRAPRYELSFDDKKEFIKNSYDRKFGGVYLHWSQIGKTLYEVFTDESAPELTTTICESITHQQFYSGEFDIEWGRDCRENHQAPWHDEKMYKFRKWLIDNNLDPHDPNLSLGYCAVGQIDLQNSFSTVDTEEIQNIVGRYLDIYMITTNNASATFDYCWSDLNHEQQQIAVLEQTYKFYNR